MNNSGPTAQIIERDGWKANRDFVGHRKAITCVVCIGMRLFCDTVIMQFLISLESLIICIVLKYIMYASNSVIYPCISRHQ